MRWPRADPTGTNGGCARWRPARTCPTPCCGRSSPAPPGSRTGPASTTAASTRPQPAAWTPLIAEGPNRDVLDGVTMLGDRFVVTWQIDARHALRVYDLRGTLEREIALPTLGSVGFSSRRRDHEGFYSFTSFTYP